MQEQPSPSDPHPDPAPDLKAEIAKLAFEAPPEPLHAGARLRNYFLTGLVVVGPVTITLYIAWYFINIVDNWVKPYIPRLYNPDTYLPFPIPGLGLLFAIIGLTLIGALAANLLVRSLISGGELMFGFRHRMTEAERVLAVEERGGTQTHGASSRSSFHQRRLAPASTIAGSTASSPASAASRSRYRSCTVLEVATMLEHPLARRKHRARVVVSVGILRMADALMRVEETVQRRIDRQRRRCGPVRRTG